MNQWLRGILSRTELSDGYSDQNCKLHGDSSIENKLLAELYEERGGGQYQSLLFYCNSRWLSRVTVVTRVYNLQEVALIPEEENLLHAEHFRSEHFVSKLACLSRVFEKFNSLNPSMQRNDMNTIVVADEVKAFTGKLGLWFRKLE
jgi:hypothetical protein